MATWLSLPIMRLLPSDPDQMYFDHRLFSMPGAQRAPHGEPHHLAQRGVVAPLARPELADRRLDALAQLHGPRHVLPRRAHALHGALRAPAQPSLRTDH